MPIYAYRCESCGFAQDVLRKISDPLLSVCPECGKDAFRKQVTAAGFQLKGSGWYVTDFRNNGSAPASKGASAGATSDGPASAGPAAPAGGDASSSASPGASSSAASASPASNSGAASSDGATSSS